MTSKLESSQKITKTVEFEGRTVVLEGFASRKQSNSRVRARRNKHKQDMKKHDLEQLIKVRRLLSDGFYGSRSEVMRDVVALNVMVGARGVRGCVCRMRSSRKPSLLASGVDLSVS